ncbi:transmembrane channel-like protein [Leptopilina boulardi]|uniref:transmembrane channel-like protein n=1 Tax=Leptopilina boulardi TaxID=63433 RepID=UPI0021F51320|nr:transmembrane channel-like protein [Leptopilina boulardi]
MIQRGVSINDGQEEPGEEDDYSISACAIIQRRNSTRKSKKRHRRRSSSPFNPDSFDTNVRRRSSVYTTSSGDTAISMEEKGEELIFEKLKLHKEVLSGIRQQPWPLRRKIKLARQAKIFVKQHEGALHDRLAQRHNTRDILARMSILLDKKWQYYKREIVNIQTFLIPWEHRIKDIESHFGSAVASFFTFLRWLFWINLVISGILTAFIAIPEILMAIPKDAGERKIMLPEEEIKSKELLTLWEFEGVLKYSPFFYGWYTNKKSNKIYQLPMAYFITNIVVYTYSFVVILRKMAKNSRMSKLSEKEDEYAFSWKLFTSWDFMIGNPETSNNRTSSITLGFKEALLEEAEKAKDKRSWKTIVCRIFVNLSVLFLLSLSAYIVIEIVARSTQPEANSNWWRQNEITVIMSLINYIFPIFFEILGILENYHPRKQLRLQLARIMVLNLLNQYSLIFALFSKIDIMQKQLQSLKPNKTKVSTSTCKYFPKSCYELNLQNMTMTLASLSLVLTNSTQVASPIEKQISINDFLQENETYLHVPKFNYFNDLSSLSTQNNHVETTNEVTSEFSETSEIYEEISEITSQISEITTQISEETSEISDDDDRKYSSTTSLQDSDYQNYLFKDDDDPHVDYTYYDFLNISDKTIFVNENKTDSTIITEQVTESYPIIFNNRCFVKVCNVSSTISEEREISSIPLSLEIRTKLRRLCWETMFGQELAKLTVMDLVMTILSVLTLDFIRAIFVRYMNNCWCWDLEKKFPQYGDFKIAENILYLINNQGMVWMGMFFSPGLITLNVLKLGILMHIRSWAVLNYNVPHKVIFRASRSNNFYFALLLTMLFLCVLPVGYAIVWVEPSWHCGPFSQYKRIYHLGTKTLQQALPEKLQKIFDYIVSPGIVIPLIVLMVLIIYYMVSLTGSLREANNDLKIQLRQERTEERRKMFKIAEKRQEIQETPFTRWKNILPSFMPSRKDTGISIVKDESENPNEKSIELPARGMSMTSDAGDITEGELESLPHDQNLRSESIRKLWRKAARSNSESKNVEESDSAIPEIHISVAGEPGEQSSPTVSVFDAESLKMSL